MVVKTVKTRGTNTWDVNHFSFFQIIKWFRFNVTLSRLGEVSLNFKQCSMYRKIKSTTSTKTLYCPQLVWVLKKKEERGSQMVDTLKLSSDAMVDISWLIKLLINKNERLYTLNENYWPDSRVPLHWISNSLINSQPLKQLVFSRQLRRWKELLPFYFFPMDSPCFVSSRGVHQHLNGSPERST